MSVVYVKEQYSYIQLFGETIRVTKNNERLLEYPIHSIDNLVIIGSVQISTQAVIKLLQSGVDISYFSYNGKYLGHTLAETSKNIFLRFSQYECYNDVERRTAFAKAIVANKIDNQMQVIRRFMKSDRTASYDFDKDLKQMNIVKQSLESKNNNNEIMGVEGICSNIYFSSFREMLKCDIEFEGRNRRPPRDPVNALLSLTYTFLTKDMCMLIDNESFESYIGFLHGIRYGRKSLALDMIEEWRQPIADRLVLNMLNKRILSQYDFREGEDNGIYLNEQGFHKFCTEYEKYLNGRGTSSINYRQLMKKQIGKLKKALENGTVYEPYKYIIE